VSVRVAAFARYWVKGRESKTFKIRRKNHISFANIASFTCKPVVGRELSFFRACGAGGSCKPLQEKSRRLRALRDVTFD
jgi:hypothetical protein